MKNAFVLDDHHGDDGTVIAGMILKDVTNQRFEALEKAGLVREATAAEVKEGFKPEIEADESKAADGDDGSEKKQPEPANKKAADPANKRA